MSERTRGHGWSGGGACGACGARWCSVTANRSGISGGGEEHQ